MSRNTRDGLQAPAVCICSTAEVTSTGLGICAAGSGIGDAFGPVEEEFKTAFIPEVFHGVGDGAPERVFTRLTVKQAGLALPGLTRKAPEN